MPAPIKTPVRPIEIGTAPVAVTGDKLDEIVWRGRQWAVTRHGIEALDGTYVIDADRLAEDMPDHSWLTHMGEKEWVDFPEFTTAFMVAIVVHGYAPKFDRNILIDQFGKTDRQRSADGIHPRRERIG